MSIKKAGIINAVSKYTNVITNLVFTAILARLLSPSDYGIIAVITVFTNFFVILADMGLGTGVIQNKTLTDDETNHIFSITIYIGVILAIAFCIFGYPISLFYKNSVYFPVCLVISLSLLFNAWNMVPNALLMKNQQFIKVAFRNVMVPVITSVIAIVLAFLNFKYYALAIQSVMAAFITFVWNYLTVKKDYTLKFQMKIDFEGFNKIRSYSGYQFAFSIVNYFSRNLDNLLTSKFLGEALLGYYDKAYKLMLYPLNMLTSVITPALHPILSHYQDNREYIFEKYIKILKLLSICGIFIVPFCFTSGYEIIYIMFGKNWLIAVPCFQALSLSVWCQMLTSSTGAIFQSLNNTKSMLKSSIINTMITISLLFVGLTSGRIEAIALCVSFAYIINYIITFKILMDDAFHMNMWKLNRELVMDFIYMCLALVIFTIVFKYVHISNVFVSVVLKGSIQLIVYLCYLVLTKKICLILNLIKK